jgi:CheY-like chemotaxis protein
MGKQIMVVDDEPEMVQLVTAVLELANFKVVPFSDPKKGLGALEKGLRPDLIVLDVMMPGLSGPEFCEKVRKDLNLADTKIVYLTAYADAVAHRLQEHNVMGIIPKPFDVDELANHIHQYVNR